jgi:hypothetical protein
MARADRSGEIMMQRTAFGVRTAVALIGITLSGDTETARSRFAFLNEAEDGSFRGPHRIDRRRSKHAIDA